MKIAKMATLSFDLSEPSDEFIEEWESNVDALDDEMRDHIPLKCVNSEFFKALCYELGIKSSYQRDEITHIRSVF
ncbi:hypothetical protein ROCKET24_198 [Vibrio phage Rocket24]|uniref:Uncharacterized protein n=1 Tax=Vibrio phage Chester TaxID=2712961 RepID=A0A6G8R5J7_9CAUD|nr:hypothetical protein KNU88_gp001 [Vibrio phage Chester]YP_010105964.1 hypothetical protein KNU88_gp108 [Vibrio phage Chester]QIG66122.1 hypothetical protein CILSICK_1 [Vibrio phage Cilsick]WBU77007.1 hypothetical protein NOELLE_1 [Vibrio phage Noelle]WCD55696.1 hypothetical protein ROCKET24_1 [Vibrio phage Rocket24]QIG66299.1 hypothetical protein CILSICK_200 [Vibrio phage Cilsick]QIN96428.1 hypothetical protein CHESTER_1 [Vibrio phage Chester]